MHQMEIVGLRWLPLEAYFPIDPMVIDSDPRNRDEKGEAAKVVVFTDNVDIERLGTFVGDGIDKSRMCFTGRNVASHPILIEVAVHFTVTRIHPLDCRC